jgi:acetyl-CoA carboxylase beta subunit
MIETERYRPTTTPATHMRPRLLLGASHKCPRCTGSMYSDADVWGEYEGCLNCGYVKDTDG